MATLQEAQRMAALLPRSLAAGFAILTFVSSMDDTARNWIILNNSDIGTHWNPSFKTAPCQVRTFCTDARLSKLA